MSYSLLSGLYFGESTNADLTDQGARRRLHVATPLEAFIEDELIAGRDVILTGNPGDGKSHLARMLQDEAAVGQAEVQLDLSAEPTEAVLEQWSSAARRGAPLLLCANEGPLLDLLSVARHRAGLKARAEEAGGQLQHLLVADRRDLPPRPQSTVVVDLADRNVLDLAVVEAALARVCRLDFMPRGLEGADTAPGLNLRLLAESSTARARLAAVVAALGALREGHTTFRELWQTLSYTLCSGLSLDELDFDRPAVLAHSSPLEQLCAGTGEGELLRLAPALDPARVAAPELDEDLWRLGRPGTGRWLLDLPDSTPPSERWATEPAEALASFQRLKRLVALFHEEGAWLIERVTALIRGRTTGAELEASILEGLRRLYVTGPAETLAPAWLLAGLPLWVAHSYEGRRSLGARPHVVVHALEPSELELTRPLRPEWLREALGEVPPVLLLRHRASGISLAITPSLLECLREAQHSEGGLEPPEVVQRFLARLGGWADRARPAQGTTRFAVLERPRGELVARGGVQVLPGLGARYVAQ